MRGLRICAGLLPLAFILVAGCGSAAGSGHTAASVAGRPEATAPATTQSPAPAAGQAGKPPAGPPGQGCAGRPVLADVYHPDRLRVIRPCLTVTGTVALIRHEPDGDWHINLRLPASETGLLDAANDRYERGELVAEVVPADEAGCGPVGAPARVPATAYRGPGYEYGTCSGLDLRPPAVGTRVAVTGPYVLDADHGWRELHPVERIEVLG